MVVAPVLVCATDKVHRSSHRTANRFKGKLRKPPFGGNNDKGNYLMGRGVARLFGTICAATLEGRKRWITTETRRRLCLKSYGLLRLRVLGALTTVGRYTCQCVYAPQRFSLSSGASVVKTAYLAPSESTDNRAFMEPDRKPSRSKVT